MDKDCRHENAQSRPLTTTRYCPDCTAILVDTRSLPAATIREAWSVRQDEESD